jgi:hypothetical protein
MKVKVLCSYVITVDLPERMRDSVHFYVEDNHCPGTVEMGSEIERIMKEQEKKSCCWACAVNGKCKILEIDGQAVNP